MDASVPKIFKSLSKKDLQKGSESIAGELEMRLDVGFGNTPTGDVNIDFLGSERHRGGVKLAAKSIPNFICASAYVLPFRDNFFDAHAKAQFPPITSWNLVLGKGRFSSFHTC